MSRRLLRPRNDVCQLCDFMLAKQSTGNRTIRAQRFSTPTRVFSTGRRLHNTIPQDLNAGELSRKPRIEPVSSGEQNKPVARHATEAEMQKALQQVRATCAKLLSLSKVPTEEEASTALSQCEAVARLLVLDAPIPSEDKKNGATSALLSLGESESKKTLPPKITPNIQNMIYELTEISYSVIKFPPVFITPGVLDIYVTIQAILGAPETLPDAMYLYANKPVAVEGSSPIRYSRPTPNKVANAIPKAVADRALQTAINAKRLVPAMDIIQAAFTTPAFRRDKLVRKALLPATALTAAPVAIYAAASQLAEFQTSMDSAAFTKVAFVGGMAYLVLTTTVGGIAVSTANDQMVRVTWAPGVPLRSRWMREEERAAIDKVAVAWGFREVWRRGEEEGEDWDLLRQWIGGKAMMLDRVELMEGME